MAKTKNNTSEEVRASVASIYSDLLSKRREEREAKEEKKRQEEELRRQEKEARKEDDKNDSKLSKKEREKKELDNWKQVIVGLTGEDLEYSSTKKSKKKYRKWIDDEGESSILTPKPKKHKKKNYNKEFAPELQMLRSIVADQNKFTADLQKRFNAMAGPATKDAMPMNKTMVDLASVINAGRSNSLGMMNAIGNVKKTIADLYFKQLKEEGANAGASMMPTDIALMGSSIASSLFGDEPMMPVAPAQSYSAPTATPQYSSSPVSSGPIQAVAKAYPSETPGPVITAPQIAEFDPASWDGPDSLKVNESVKYETIPHTVVVEMNRDSGNLRFKAIHNDTGEELPNCPIPTYDPRNLKINEKDHIAKGQFDETYKLEVI